MDDAAISQWACEEFPELPPIAVRRWLEAGGQKHSLAEGESLFFSDDPLDKLLLHLHTRPDPVPVGRLTDFLGGDERNARIRVERDPRFVEDDFKNVLPAERCSFHRRGGLWSLRLVPLEVGDAERKPQSISVSELIHLVVGGLVQAGIADATVWGVHRFARIQLERVYGSTLASAVTPFVLAGALAGHSEGVVRHMRRRRLRWDCADGSIAVRGKRGWIDHLATRAGVPMTFDELDGTLREHYQDYEPYVLKQLHLADDEDGGSDFGFRYIPGVSNAVPGVLIPRDWEFDPAAVNVSRGVLLAASNLASMSARSPVPRSHVNRIPWMIPLCEAAAPGTMRWSDKPSAVAAELPCAESDPESVSPPQASAAAEWTPSDGASRDLMS